MTKHSWIRQLFTRPVTRPIRNAPHRARLAVEALEERCVPSTLTVTNTLDDGSAGSLRWAIGQANSQGGSDTINFGALFNTPQKITLAGTQLELTDMNGATTITGPAAGVTVSGGGLSRVFQIDANVTASISGLTISGGKASGLFGGIGGGLFNFGTATLTNCTVSGNAARYGGGMANQQGTLALTNCTVSGNSGPGGGGGLANNPYRNGLAHYGTM